MPGFEIRREGKELSPTIFSVMEKADLLPQVWQSKRWLVPLSGLFVSLSVFTLLAFEEAGMLPSLPVERVENLATVSGAVEVEIQDIAAQIYNPLIQDFGESVAKVEEIGRSSQSLVSETTVALEDNFYSYLKGRWQFVVNQSVESWTSIFLSLEKARESVMREIRTFKLVWVESLSVVGERLKVDASTLSAQMASGLSKVGQWESVLSNSLTRSWPAFSYSLRGTAVNWSEFLKETGKIYNQNLAQLFSSSFNFLSRLALEVERLRLSLREEIAFSSQGIWSRMTQYQTKAVANWKNFLGTDGTINLDSLPPEMRE